VVSYDTLRACSADLGALLASLEEEGAAAPPPPPPAAAGPLEPTGDAEIDALLASREADAWVAEGRPRVSASTLNFVKIDTEGYDVAVADGALMSVIRGRVPYMLIEFSPSDAAGTAGCDVPAFARIMYENDYVMVRYKGDDIVPVTFK
jgi:hypothetical protein